MTGKSDVTTRSIPSERIVHLAAGESAPAGTEIVPVGENGEFYWDDTDEKVGT